MNPEKKRRIVAALAVSAALFRAWFYQDFPFPGRRWVSAACAWS